MLQKFGLPVTSVMPGTTVPEKDYVGLLLKNIIYAISVNSNSSACVLSLIKFLKCVTTSCDAYTFV